jgi:DNA-binding GntR family transcriptional regulator
LEALVLGVPGARDPAGTTERRRIMELTGGRILSVAELSAHLSLPLGVVRVVVGDLADEGLLVVHSGSPTAAPPATNLTVLEGVLNGISSL